MAIALYYDILNSEPVFVIVCMLGFIFQSGVFANNCTTTAINGNDVTTRLQQIKPIAVIDYPTDTDHDTMRLDVSMCPDNGSLKIVWNTNSTKDCLVQLCYKMNAVLDGRHIGTACFDLQLSRSSHPLTVSCWFPMTTFADRPIINAWAISRDPGGSRHYAGHLNTALLDPDRPCGDVCEITSLLIPNFMSCNHNTSIKYDKDVRIKRVTLVQHNDTRNELNISQKTEDQFQYFLNCSRAGDANIQVLYVIRDQFCLKYQPVRVMCTGCDKGSVSPLMSDDGQPFGTFVSFGIVCMATVSIIAGLIVAIVQNKDRLAYYCRRSNRGMDSETFPMNPNNPRVRVTFQATPTSSVTDVMRHSQRHRVDSTSSGANGTSKDIPVKTKPAKSHHRLQRSATMALLEVTDPVYTKKILFLPSIWDPFSRDVTNFLKQLFTEGTNVTAQCCYDRDVYQQYMTGDKYKSIEHLLGDRNRIVVFLCFTNLDSGDKRPDELDMFEDVLSHLLRTRNMSHLLCKVIYLHLTDSEGSQLERNHLGDSYRINNSDNFAIFLRDTMVTCGLKPDEATSLAQSLFRSKPSEEFLRFIGLGEHGPWYSADVMFERSPSGRQIMTSVRL